MEQDDILVFAQPFFHVSIESKVSSVRNIDGLVVSINGSSSNEMKRTQSIEWWNENENTAFAHLSLVCASDEPLCSPPILLSD